MSAWPTAALGELTLNHDGKRRPVNESDRRAGQDPYYGASGVVDHVDDYLIDGDYLLIAEDGERHAADFKKGCVQSKVQCIELRRDGNAVATGYLLDSSNTHIANFDTAVKRARALPRDGLELVAGGPPPWSARTYDHS